MDKKLEVDEGYYWVKVKGSKEPVIGRHFKTISHDYWIVMGCTSVFLNNQIEVLSRQILREVEE